MSTLVELDPGTLIHVAVSRLIAVIRAVRHLVTHQRGVDTLPAGTPELVGAAHGRRSVPATRWTSILV